MGGYTTINPTPSGDITGSGTANYISMFTGTNTIGNSTIYQTANAYIPATKDLNFASAIIAVAPNMNTGQQVSYSFYGGTDTTQSTTQEINRYLFSPGNRQWAAGTVAIQREFYITSPTYSFVSASTIADAYTLYLRSPTAGTNATITNNYGLGIEGYVNVIADTATIKLRSLVGTTSSAAIYFNQTSPTANNYAVLGTSTQTRLNGPTDVLIRVGNSTKFNIDSSSTQFIQDTITSGAVTPYSFTFGANSSQTASTEISNFKVTGNTKTWLAGAITTQRWNYFTANTAAFASASTIAESFGLYVEAATAGSNATITNNFGLGLLAGTATIKMGNLTGSTTEPAIYLNQSTPSNTNFSLHATNVTTVVNGAATGVSLQVAGQEKILIYGLRTSGSSSNYNFSTLNNTGMTASTEIPGYLYNSYSRQWATGNITTQRERYYKTVTYTAVGASTITTAYGAYFEAPTASTNVTITNNYAAGFLGNTWVGYDASNYLSTSVASTGEVTNTLVGTTKTLNFSSSGSTVLKINSSSVITYIGTDGGGGYMGTNTAHAFRIYSANVQRLSFAGSGTGDCTVSDALNFVLGSTTGNKFATATTQKLSFWNATPIVQPTTGVAAATFVANTSLIANDTATFDGYTIGQVVKALRNTGLLA